MVGTSRSAVRPTRTAPPRTTAPTTAATSRPLATSKPRWASARGPAGGHGDDVADDLHELIGLEQRQRAEHRRDGEERGEGAPARPEGLADHVHRSALDPAERIRAAVHHRQRAGEELGADAEQRRQPHPEHGAGAADGDRHGDAGDVAEPEGAGQRSGEGFALGQLTRRRLRPSRDAAGAGRRPRRSAGRAGRATPRAATRRRRAAARARRSRRAKRSRRDEFRDRGAERRRRIARARSASGAIDCGSTSAS